MSVAVAQNIFNNIYLNISTIIICLSYWQISWKRFAKDILKNPYKKKKQRIENIIHRMLIPKEYLQKRNFQQML